MKKTEKSKTRWSENYAYLLIESLERYQMSLSAYLVHYKTGSLLTLSQNLRDHGEKRVKKPPRRLRQQVQIIETNGQLS